MMNVHIETTLTTRLIHVKPLYSPGLFLMTLTRALRASPTLASLGCDTEADERDSRE